jgi:Rrf2 family protein
VISKTDQYALRAVLFIAQQGREGSVRAAEIAEGLGLPGNYLSKILHTLTRSGILLSERGPRGGFRMARPAAEVKLADVIAPFDSIVRHRTCLLGRSECSDESPCRVHARWKVASDPVADFFNHTAIADLIGEEDLCD